MLHTRKSFSVPATTPTKTLCAVHHIVKGKCLRCPHVVKQTLDAHLETLDAYLGEKVGAAIRRNAERQGFVESVPTDSEGPE